jgi:predicted DNA binding CopG/RHH family protein
MKPVPKMSSPSRVEEVMSQGLEKFEVSKRFHKATEKCLQEHSHARHSIKSKEMDLALV